MGEIVRQAKTELRQLPQMLGKLLGGIGAVIGFTAAVVIITRRPGALVGDVMLSLLVGFGGVAIFLLSARALTRHLAAHETETPSPADSARSSLLSLGLLLLIAGIFLAGVWFMTR